MTETGEEISIGRSIWEKTTGEAGSRTSGGREQEEETGKDPEIEDRVGTDTERETHKDRKTEHEQEPGAGREDWIRILWSRVKEGTGRGRAGLPGWRKRMMVRGRGEPRVGSVSSLASKRCLTSPGVTKAEGTPGNSGTLGMGRVPVVNAFILIPAERQVPP